MPRRKVPLNGVSSEAYVGNTKLSVGSWGKTRTEVLSVIFFDSVGAILDRVGPSALNYLPR